MVFTEQKNLRQSDNLSFLVLCQTVIPLLIGKYEQVLHGLLRDVAIYIRQCLARVPGRGQEQRYTMQTEEVYVQYIYQPAYRMGRRHPA